MKKKNENKKKQGYTITVENPLKKGGLSVICQCNFVDLYEDED